MIRVALALVEATKIWHSKLSKKALGLIRHDDAQTLPDFKIRFLNTVPLLGDSRRNGKSTTSITSHAREFKSEVRLGILYRPRQAKSRLALIPHRSDDWQCWCQIGHLESDLLQCVYKVCELHCASPLRPGAELQQFQDKRKMHIILTGATGLVGSACLQSMLTNNTITKVSILSRRPVPMAANHAKAKVIIHKDYTDYPPDLLAQLKGATGCVWAQGVSANDVSKS